MVRRSSYTPKFLYWKNVLQGLFSSSLAARWPGNDSSPSRSKSNAWERCLARQICPASNQTGRVVCVLQIWGRGSMRRSRIFQKDRKWKDSGERITCNSKKVMWRLKEGKKGRWGDGVGGAWLTMMLCSPPNSPLQQVEVEVEVELRGPPTPPFPSPKKGLLKSER